MEPKLFVSCRRFREENNFISDRSFQSILLAKLITKESNKEKTSSAFYLGARACKANIKSISLTFPKQFEDLAHDSGEHLLYFLPQVGIVRRGAFVDGKTTNFLFVGVRVEIRLH